MDGILNVYKEKGFTSFDVVAKLRGILHMKKIGHTGTLDPDAEGVLLVCLGSATKLCGMLTDKFKEYEAVLRLGVTTDTQDMTGTVLEERAVSAKEESVREAVRSFVGEYDQIPPMYSALKVDGKKLCDLARQGKEVERRARRVTIYGIEILSVSLPVVTMRVHCSKGTYIRTLCHDIGAKLGCGGCMESLVRTKTADFRIEDAKTLAQIERCQKEGRLDEWIHPADTLFGALSAVKARADGEKPLHNGNPVRAAAADFLQDRFAADGEQVRMYHSDGTFCGIYAYCGRERSFWPVRIFDLNGGQD